MQAKKASARKQPFLTSAVFRLSALFVEAGYILGSCETSILHTVRISNISSGENILCKNTVNAGITFAKIDRLTDRLFPCRRFLKPNSPPTQL